MGSMKEFHAVLAKIREELSHDLVIPRLMTVPLTKPIVREIRLDNKVYRIMRKKVV